MLHEVIVAKDVQKAEAALLKLPGLRKFHDNLKSDREKEDFRRHMRKYINMWSTDCPFEVSTTNRYTITTHEAAVTARRTIKKGELVKYLCGHLVAMSQEEEKDLDFNRQDFSIVMSSRKKTPSFFLGPARFANHDCNANARLVTKGNDGMDVVAVREIREGEEITVTYGEDYFGEDNCECLCLTCEKLGRNGWPAREQSTIVSGTATPLGVEKPGSYSLRSSRADPSILGSGSMTPELSELPPRKRRKTSITAALSPIKTRASDNPVLGGRRKLEKPPSSLRHELEPIHPRRPRDTLHNQALDDLPAKEEKEHAASLTAALTKAKGQQNKRKRTFGETVEAGPGDILQLQAPATTIKGQSIGVQRLPMIDVPESPRTPTNPIFFAPKATAGIGGPQSSVSASSSATPYSAPPNSTPATLFSTSGTQTPPKLDLDMMDNSDSDLSDLDPTDSFDDASRSIIYAPRPSTPAKPAATVDDSREDVPSPLIPTIEAVPPLEETAVNPRSTRTPGDYIRTPLLLGEQYSRWVDCSTCKNTWVQANSYLTKKECPRCERHSKLYGYQWPKTEKAGKDDEERVMDHRTVHRFITAEEERTVGKRGKGLVKSAEDVVDEDKGNDEEQEEGEVEEPPKRKTRTARTKVTKVIGKGKGKGKVAETVGKGEGKAKATAKANASPKGSAKAKGKAKAQGKAKVKVSDDKVVKKRRGRPPKVKTA